MTLDKSTTEEWTLLGKHWPDRNGLQEEEEEGQEILKALTGLPSSTAHALPEDNGQARIFRFSDAIMMHVAECQAGNWRAA